MTADAGSRPHRDRNPAGPDQIRRATCRVGGHAATDPTRSSSSRPLWRAYRSRSSSSSTSRARDVACGHEREPAHLHGIPLRVRRRRPTRATRPVVERLTVRGVVRPRGSRASGQRAHRGHEDRGVRRDGRPCRFRHRRRPGHHVERRTRNPRPAGSPIAGGSVLLRRADGRRSGRLRRPTRPLVGPRPGRARRSWCRTARRRHDHADGRHAAQVGCDGRPGRGRRRCRCDDAVPRSHRPRSRALKDRRGPGQDGDPPAVVCSHQASNRSS